MLDDAEGHKVARVIPVITGVNNISEPCTSATLDEAEEIWANLEASLDLDKGYGLTANQIGVNKRVGFIRYNEKTYRLLNPRIVEQGPTVIIYNEGCLSLPGQTLNTERAHTITIDDDIQGHVQFTMSKDGLLPIIIQHEVDHMDGKTIFDRRRVPIRRESEKIGRNQLCPCGSGRKYKKCCIHGE